MPQENTLQYLAYYAGRILLLCFAQWMLDHPDAEGNRGFLFAKNVSDYINEAMAVNESFRKIGLSGPVPMDTLVMAFFYSDRTSRYFQSRNMGSNFTFRYLFERKKNESGIDCRYYNHRLCQINNFSLTLKSYT